MSYRKPIAEEEVWQCFVCNRDFFVLEQSPIVCPACGNSNVEMLQLKEELDEERDNDASIQSAIGQY